MKGYLKFLVVALLIVSGLIACSNGTFPKGSYVAEKTGARLEFEEDGSYIYTDEGVVWATGTYSIDGNELVWETDDSCDDSASEKATYTWTYEGGLLVLEQKGDDLCDGRVHSIHGLEWKYQD